MKTRKTTRVKRHKVIFVVVVFVSFVAFNVFAQPVLEPNAVSRASAPQHKVHKEAKPISQFNYQPTKDCVPITFETLGGFAIKVDWVMNATNSAFDTLKKEGEIPEKIRSLQGKKVSISGFMKPLKQDTGVASEFLLMRYFSTCCEGKTPQINEWLHVRTTGKAIPLANERMLAVRGVLQVGEKFGAGNVVSIYRLEEAEFESMGSSD